MEYRIIHYWVFSTLKQGLRTNDEQILLGSFDSMDLLRIDRFSLSG